MPVQGTPLLAPSAPSHQIYQMNQIYTKNPLDENSYSLLPPSASSIFRSSPPSPSPDAAPTPAPTIPISKPAIHCKFSGFYIFVSITRSFATEPAGARLARARQ